MIKLIVAHGNPGIEYELTRHNIAWTFVDTYPALANCLWKNKFNGEYSDFSFKGQKIFVLKPLTFMNLSGKSVAAFCQFFKIESHEILVIQDELDLSFGQIHFKDGGGLAGHNGLKSIASHLSNQDFFRLRIGIGRPPKGSVSSWVLSKIPTSQNIELEVILNHSYKALELLMDLGLKKASTEYNKKNLLELK